MLKKSEINFEEIRNSSKVLCSFPFNSMRKRRSAIAQVSGKNHIFVQGSSEIILDFCGKWKNKTDGTVQEIDE